MRSIHRSVLLHETVDSLVPKEVLGTDRPFWYLDGTLGGAGHALAIADAVNGKLNVIGLDRDPRAIERAKETLAGKCDKLILELSNFRDMDKALAKHGIDGVDAILLDLGLSSDELEDSGKGFSFMKDEPLLMTMGDPDKHAFTARDILNDWAEEDIANVIFAYGEERYARRIARVVVEYRTKKRFETTHELVEVVKSAVPPMYRHRKINPATKTFQALRIAVNDELKSIEVGLAKGYECLHKGGRLGVISFHSLEDRIVKHFMRDREAEGATLVNRKAIKPGDQEVAENPRSRSAKLRVIQK